MVEVCPGINHADFDPMPRGNRPNLGCPNLFDAPRDALNGAWFVVKGCGMDRDFLILLHGQIITETNQFLRAWQWSDNGTGQPGGANGTQAGDLVSHPG